MDPWGSDGMMLPRTPRRARPLHKECHSWHESAREALGQFTSYRAGVSDAASQPLVRPSEADGLLSGLPASAQRCFFRAREQRAKHPTFLPPNPKASPKAGKPVHESSPPPPAMHLRPERPAGFAALEEAWDDTGARAAAPRGGATAAHSRG
jgi:hypothetical protein